MMTATPIGALRHAVPYLRLYRDKLFVVKAGGEAFAKECGATQILEQISVLMSLGIRIVLVHGGGVQADALGAKLGVESAKIDGRRRTSPDMIRTMVLALNGEVQGMLLSTCRKLGLPAVGLSGMDAGMVFATRRSSTPVDLGEVGDIESVRPATLLSLLHDGVLPIVSPLAGDAEGHWLNMNADTVAAHLATALGAEKVVFLTGAAGILRDPADPDSLISELLLSELRDAESAGVLKDGMLPKAKAIETCLLGGVPRVHVVSYSTPDSLLTEVFTNEGSGTLIHSGEESHA